MDVIITPFILSISVVLLWLNSEAMKRWILVVFLISTLSLLAPTTVEAQCSICTKTAQQLGEKPAKGLNGGILYLAFMPMAIVGVIGYRWWKSNKG
jgi:hypothetical protein